MIFYSAIGFCNERIKLYGATNLEKVENPRPQDADETLELLEVTLKEAKDLILSGEICACQDHHGHPILGLNQ